jgi:hypothetical protein
MSAHDPYRKWTHSLANVCRRGTADTGDQKLTLSIRFAARLVGLPGEEKAPGASPGASQTRFSDYSPLMWW